MGRPRKLSTKNLLFVKEALLRNLPLYQIAPELKVHPRTISRRIHEDPELEDYFYRSCINQAAERMLKRREKKRPHSSDSGTDHPLRTIFDYERLHPELPRHHGRLAYRSGLNAHPELCKPSIPHDCHEAKLNAIL